MPTLLTEIKRFSNCFSALLQVMAGRSVEGAEYHPAADRRYLTGWQCADMDEDIVTAALGLDESKPSGLDPRNR
jgi:hypothetical protein